MACVRTFSWLIPLALGFAGSLTVAPACSSDDDPDELACSMAGQSCAEAECCDDLVCDFSNQCVECGLEGDSCVDSGCCEGFACGAASGLCEPSA